MFDPSVNVLLSQYPIDYLADFVEIPLMSPAGGRGGGESHWCVIL